ncbi:MBOAT family protein, partial [Akkermansiaceae bacterium]|nr:MBOAT family protein [Akkermansiaceae bacterium]
VLSVGVIFNLGLLGYFKYAGFMAEVVESLSGFELTMGDIVLPLAISFFTFQQIAFLVDVHRGVQTNRSFRSYLLFVTFFPQLIAGPIVHHREMMPQFSGAGSKIVDLSLFSEGLFLFSVGLFKKVIIADSLSPWVAAGFENSENLALIDGWFLSLSYCFQLYFDFSGYSDMAMGAALLLGIRLPWNFNSPYQALSIQDFWRRWHMTLSRFLRDYVYIPLGGNRVSENRVKWNLFLTFLLGGIWHGAGWTFIIWGALHGIACVVHRAWSRDGRALPSFAAWGLTFVFVNVAWVFFRAEDPIVAMRVLGAMFGFEGISFPIKAVDKLPLLAGIGHAGEYFMAGINDKFLAMAWLGGIFWTAVFLPNTMTLTSKFSRQRRFLILAVICFVTAFVHLDRLSEFLYFQF